MAKVSIVLNCQMDNGKTVTQPGETVSMEKKEADALVAMNMASYPEKAAAKIAKAKSKAEQPPAGGVDDDPDGDGDGDDDGPGADELDPDALDEAAKG